MLTSSACHRAKVAAARGSTWTQGSRSRTTNVTHYTLQQPDVLRSAKTCCPEQEREIEREIDREILREKKREGRERERESFRGIRIKDNKDRESEREGAPRKRRTDKEKDRKRVRGIEIDR